MIKQVIPVVPVTKIQHVEDALGVLGFKQLWAHNPGQDLMYAEYSNENGLSVHASESRGDGIGPVVVYFMVEGIDELASKAGTVAEDQAWHMREFWIRDADGNTYRFGQALP